MRTYYVGMDVHRATIVIVVLNGAGKVVEQVVVETSAVRVQSYLKQVRADATHIGADVRTLLTFPTNLLRLRDMMRANSDVTVVGKINEDPILSVSDILQADDLRDVRIGARRLWQCVKE